MRTFRTAHSRTVLLAVTALVGTLALTACQDGTGTKDEGRASAPAATTTTQASDAASAAGSGSSAAQGTGTASHSGTTSGKGSSGHSSGSASGAGGTTSTTPVLCNGANTSIKAELVSRPVDHMLLTVTNTGSRTCDLTYYPTLRFDEMQWAPGAFEESKPQAVLTLAPGQSGYAGVRLSAADGSGENGTTGHRLSVLFQGRTPRSDGGPTATVKLPAKGVYYDSKLTATYWQAGATDALTW
ncbi:DUF4232 domain-containing protein [Streptomyces sp. NPDC096198]|uniref:DUF4232 domain-containing protein n=1 Tax=Streptomyces sp. NPDC096198 TaxID=3366080 RepID=UPI0037FBF714